MSAHEGRVVAIAGAAGGLGPVVAKRLAAEGASLALTDVAQERLDSLVADLDLPDERVDAQVVDLLDENAAIGWPKAIEQKLGRPDCLLHLVGGWRGGEPLTTAPLSDYEFLHDLLVRTVIHSTRAFADALAAADGRFVLVSSSQAQRPDGTNAAYGAAKAAAEAWTLALADHFRSAGSRATANVVVINAIITPQMREENPDKEFASFTSAEEIADAISFVCSDSAQKMNGKRLELYP